MEIEIASADGVSVLAPTAADASVSRPEQVAIAARDPIQDIPGIVEAGRLYAGELDVGHPFVSPLNGAFRALAPMTIFSGTHDLLYPDSVDLAERARRWPCWSSCICSVTSRTITRRCRRRRGGRRVRLSGCGGLKGKV
ncbi:MULTISPECIES: alpha/beta hydrolase fold domain-containing protein [unclassified Bradyrhizobium]|jgi:hypothetical protein|uniref:alpha/beta hydrolase fold domain-containing protein n=1 Tax=unclassified Bradyrhizobium TaxID=2631580 RepID=UPI001FF75682|nr:MULTISPECIES: alpha/beta hydrolase fold domain-containing protein [unclassified Bradyrhizobium]